MSKLLLTDRCLKSGCQLSMDMDLFKNIGLKIDFLLLIELALLQWQHII